MAHLFDETIVTAVLAHMNGDHGDDNVLTGRAFAGTDVTASVTTGFDGDGGTWRITRGDGSEEELRVPWPGGPITERAEVRREVVALYHRSCELLGIEPRSHG